MKKDNEDITTLWYRRRIQELTYNLKEARENIEVAHQNGYEQGWKDATKKIKNFIIRHCEEFEDIK